MTDEEAIEKAEQDMDALNSAATDMDDEARFEQLADGWCWIGYASEGYGYKSKADAAHSYLNFYGLH